jgi:small-conductance mechanosensitive channel
MAKRIPWLLLLALYASLLGLPLQAQSADVNVNEGVDVAMVRIDGVKLFPVCGITAYPAKRRAHEIQKRIKAIANDETIKLDALTLKKRPDRTSIMANAIEIMNVVDIDATYAKVERDLLAEIYLGRIKETIKKYRQERTTDFLLVNVLYVVAASVLLMLVLFGYRLGFRYLRNNLMLRIEPHIKSLQIKSVEILNANQIKTTLYGLFKTIKVVLIIITIYLYLEFALSLLPWTRTFAFSLIEVTMEPLKVIGEGILEYIDNIFFIIILIIFFRYVLKVISMFFSALRGGRIKLSGFEPEWAWPTYRLVRLFIIAFAFVVVFPYIPGSDSAAFKGVTLFFGVLFSLGSSSYISNIIAGYSMTYRRAFKVGNRVKIGDVIGDVEEIRLMVTHLRSLKNEEIVIPNSKILNTEITNYSTMAEQQGIILHTTVGIGYEVSWRQVEAMLLMAAQRTTGLLTEPKPFVLQKSLGDYAVIYELNVYCDDPNRMMSFYSTLHQNIQDVFNEYGVQIMTPSYVADSPTPKIVSKDAWYTAPAKPPDSTD